MSNGLTPCAYARERHLGLLRWRNLWTILLFVFGSSVVVFLSATALFFLGDKATEAALATLSTLVNGVAIKWILDRRTDAKSEEEEAYQDVQKLCAATSAEMVERAGPRRADDGTVRRERYKLFGLWL